MQMHRWRMSIDHRHLAIAWLFVSVLLAALFSGGHLPPYRGSIVLLAILTIIAIASLRLTELSLLSRLFVVLFSLPFSATAGCLFDLEFRWVCAPNIVGLSRDHEIMSKMLMMAAVGLCGMMAGLEFMAALGRRVEPISIQNRSDDESSAKTLGWSWYALLLGAAFLLSWMHAPHKTIFEAAYFSADARRSMRVGTGFPSSYLVSYLILILLYVDAEREGRGSRRRYRKLTALAGVAGYIVVVLQLLRGDRECAGLLAGAALLYITHPTSHRGSWRFWSADSQLRRMMTLALPIAGCILAFAFLETFRHSASGSVFDNPLFAKSIVDRTRSNTWTAVARNNLGLATDYHYGTIEYLHGQTYADYILSLPPRSITGYLGYQRPLDGDGNPSRWYACLAAIGGMHPVVVPFRNFGIWGVIPALFVCGALISYCETCNRRAKFSDRLLYGFVATTSMMWYWYGDMNIVRALMAWGILVAAYQLLTGGVKLQSLLYAVAPRLDQPRIMTSHHPLISKWAAVSRIDQPVLERLDFAETPLAISAASFD